jgi:hypothetical protein
MLFAWGIASEHKDKEDSHKSYSEDKGFSGFNSLFTSLMGS